MAWVKFLVEKEGSFLCLLKNSQFEMSGSPGQQLVYIDKVPDWKLKYTYEIPDGFKVVPLKVNGEEVFTANGEFQLKTLSWAK